MNNDTAYISSVIHGLEPEKVEFKFWQAETDKIFVVDTTITSIMVEVNLFKIKVAKK
ncbi:MAG: hypothetical protein IPO21_04485 [Bacteroidales bacterium]|nr:hypothetical protein [Bacteroidales bacterium]